MKSATPTAPWHTQHEDVEHAAHRADAAGAWPDGPEPRAASRTMERLGLLALAAVFAILYTPLALGTLVDDWNDPNYSHGVLVPLLVLGLLRQRHHDVYLLPRRQRWLAWGLVSGGLGALVLGSAAAESWTQRLSGVLVLLGLCGVVGGAARLRRYGPALALLACAVPLPYVLYYKISVPLQLLSARLAAATLDLLGFDVLRAGNILEVQGHALEVVGACSGIRSIMALATLALCGGVALRMAPRRSAVLVLAALPAALAGNLLRLVVTALLVVRFGPRAAAGALHETVGIVAFVASLGLLAGVVKLLGRRAVASPRRPGSGRAGWLPRPSRIGAWLQALRLESVGASIVALALLVAAGGYAGFLGVHAARPGDVPRLAALPLVLDDLMGEDIPLDDRVRAQLRPDAWVFRTYSDAAGADFGLYVAYYRDPRQGAQIHSPQHCYPGGGWRIEHADRIRVRDLRGRPTGMQRLVVAKGGRRDVVVYWYDTRTGRLTGDLALKLNLMRTALLHRPQDAAFVRWSVPIEEGEELEAATARLLHVVARAYPQLESALPFGS